MVTLKSTSALVCLLLALPAVVRAEETMTTASAKPISAGLLLGFGTDLGDDPNPWGLGFGLRGGYNLDRLYLGARFVFHLGTSYEAVSPGLNTIEIDFNLWELSVEGGYDFPINDKITIRPSLVLGIVNVMSSTDAAVFGVSASGSGSDTNLLLSPGASILYDINPDIFIGGDLRLPIVIGGGSLVGLVLYANGGLHF
jgi:opacity protein-like surface antigen